MIGRFLRIVFVVTALLSFALNALVIGVGVRLWQSRSEATSIFLSLPAQTRRDLRAALRGDDELRAARRRLAAARAELARQIASGPTDRAAMEATMAEIREATAALQERLQEKLLEELFES